MTDKFKMGKCTHFEFFTSGSSINIYLQTSSFQHLVFIKWFSYIVHAVFTHPWCIGRHLQKKNVISYQIFLFPVLFKMITKKTQFNILFSIGIAQIINDLNDNHKWMRKAISFKFSNQYTRNDSLPMPPQIWIKTTFSRVLCESSYCTYIRNCNAKV